MENVNYKEIARLLNEKNGNQNWTANGVKVWFNCQDPEDFDTNDEIVEAICQSGR